jgi:hypothetical protein
VSACAGPDAAVNTSTMPNDLRALEDAFDRELPARQVHAAPGEALLAAGRRWAAAVWAEAERAGPVDLPPEMVAWGRALAARPVFVVGVHRSGTTLLRDLLDGHPALSVLPAGGDLAHQPAPPAPAPAGCGAGPRAGTGIAAPPGEPDPPAAVLTVPLTSYS